MTAPHFLDSDDLIAVADHCVASLGALVDRDWDTTRPPGLEWTCRQTLEHVCALSYAPVLAIRSEGSPKLAFSVYPNVPIDWLLVTARTTAVIVAEVARAAPPDVRAWHPAGFADPSGFVAMMGTELVLHTHDIASGFGAPFKPDDFITRALLERLFPWWPRGEDPWLALQWGSGRIELGDLGKLGDTWAWHCAPLDEWDGTIPRWDPATGTKVTH